jgi:hypothetical protein
MSGIIAAGKDARAVCEQNYTIGKLSRAKLEQSVRSAQITLAAKNARCDRSVSALLNELNAILSFHAPYPQFGLSMQTQSRGKIAARGNTPEEDDFPRADWSEVSEAASIAFLTTPSMIVADELENLRAA